MRGTVLDIKCVVGLTERFYKRSCNTWIHLRFEERVETTGRGKNRGEVEGKDGGRGRK